MPGVYIFCLHTLYICITGYLHYFYHVAIMTTEVIIYNFHNKRSPSPLRRLSDIHWEDEAYIYIYIYLYLYCKEHKHKCSLNT